VVPRATQWRQEKANDPCIRTHWAARTAVLSLAHSGVRTRGKTAGSNVYVCPGPFVSCGTRSIRESTLVEGKPFGGEKDRKPRAFNQIKVKRRQECGGGGWGGGWWGGGGGGGGGGVGGTKERGEGLGL